MRFITCKTSLSSSPLKLCILMFFQISTTTGELRHDNAMGLLHTLEDASKGFVTISVPFYNLNGEWLCIEALFLSINGNAFRCFSILLFPVCHLFIFVGKGWSPPEDGSNMYYAECSFQDLSFFFKKSLTQFELVQ